jgi:hypothetical protein
MNAIIRQLRAMAALPRQFVRPSVYFALGVMRTVGYGLSEAAKPPASCQLTHRVARDPNDLATYVVRLANRLARPDVKGARIDIVLVEADDVDISRYVLAPYLWTESFNVHIVSDEAELDSLPPTLSTDNSGVETSKETGSIGAASIGRVHLPAIFMNQGREFLKANDWAARYCAISLDAERLPVWIDAFRGLEKSRPKWYFLPLGINPFSTGLAGVSLPNVIPPSRSGIGFLGQLAIAMEADAYIGAADVYGVASVLASVPSTWLAQEGHAMRIVVADPNSKPRYAPTNTSVAEEIEALIDRHQALAQLGV